MAYIYLSKKIELQEDQIEKANEMAIEQLQALYFELLQHLPLIEKEVAKLNPNWIVEAYKFDSDMVTCDDWYEGKWNTSYMFDISIKSPDGNPDCDFQIDEWDEWKKLGEPMYKDVFEPLQKCKWEGFKRDDVAVQFSVINVVYNNRGNGVHVYNNSEWL
jgi:hypothetical protein